MMPRDEEVVAPARCLRDLGRAVKTFALVADIENGELIEAVPYSGGPFVLSKGQEWFSDLVLLPCEGVDEDELLSHLRAGVNAATALLRSGGYRVSLQIKPPEQVEIPGAESGKQSQPAPETQADVEPPEEETTEAEEATEAEAAAEETPPEAPSETGVKARKRKTAGASAS
jgi:hypothetical protein